MPRSGEGEYLKITDPDKPQETPPTRPKKSLSQLLADYRQSTGLMIFISFTLLISATMLVVMVFQSLIGLIQRYNPDWVLENQGWIIFMIAAMMILGLTKSVLNCEPRTLIGWSLILLTILVPMRFWLGLPPPKEVDRTVIIHRQRPVQEKILARNIGWMTWQVTPEKQRLIRVYEGDRFEYNSTKGFKIYGEASGRTYYHNPSSHPDEIRFFYFYNVPINGADVYIISEDDKTYEIKFRVLSSKI